jgi:hypothetical protein
MYLFPRCCFLRTIIDNRPKLRACINTVVKSEAREDLCNFKFGYSFKVKKRPAQSAQKKIKSPSTRFQNGKNNVEFSRKEVIGTVH